jgi:CRISPR-associated protein Csb3
VTDFILERGEPYVALSHLALYGLGAILEEAGYDVRLSWTTQLRSRPRLSGLDLDDDRIGNVVREHAKRHAAKDSWVSSDLPPDGSGRGLMSPRLSQFHDRQAWEGLQRARHEVLDLLTEHRYLLDLRMLAALGEPAYWSKNDAKNKIEQDDGASKWEMQPRNSGAEIIGSRLRNLASKVGDREPLAVVDGLRGSSVRDEISNDKVDSRTATGLAAPGPTDNAVAWCALWGISQLPIAPRVSGRRQSPAATTGHIGHFSDEWFYLPMWHQPWRPARLRTLLASAQLRTAASSALRLSERNTPTALAIESARRWLTGRGIIGVIRFPIKNFGTGHAAERRTMRGEPVTVRT